MATINYFTEQDSPLITFGAASPDTTPADPGGSSPISFSVDAEVICTGETITSVTFIWGDGTGDTVAGAPAGTTYSADHSYLLAGTFGLSVVAVTSGGSSISSILNPIIVT